MNKSLIRPMAAVIAASPLIALASASAAPKPSAVTAWAPDKALAATLGPPADLAGYKMRLPAGYIADLKKDETQGAVRARFFSVHRADSAGPTMLVAVTTVPTGMVVNDTAQQLLDGDGYTKGKADIIKTAPQAGRIHGLQALRQYFKYTAGGRVTHGFHYSLIDGPRLLLVVAVDEAPRSGTSLPLAEAAVLTLRKR